MSVPILWEDANVIVVNKPAGILSTAPPEVPSVQAQLQTMLRQRSGAAAAQAVRLVHRLDRPVSGVLVAALSQRTARLLSEQFVSQKVEKRYLTWVEGEVDPAQGTWTDTMRKVPEEARAELVGEGVCGARAARLEYSVRERRMGQTLLEIQLQTGRMHQIRLQASSRRHAVLGDRLYGSEQSFGPEAEDPRAAAIALHAWRVVFRHPRTAKPVEIKAPLPPYWPRQTP